MSFGEHEDNRVAWNEAAEYYRKTLESDIRFLKNEGMTFCPPELKNLASVRTKIKTCIHLQCAAGSDTLSLIHFGADQVIGLDISEEMLRLAQDKSNALGMNARWIHSDVLNAPAELNQSADFIYTGKGAINWIMDINAWAKVVMRLLKPDGVFYLFEGHPFTYVFDMKAAELKIDPVYRGYFSKSPYLSQEWPETYVGKIKENEKEQSNKHEKAWPVSAVINSLLDAGLVIQRFEEHPDSYWKEFQNLPDNLREYIPNTYSIIARKPAVAVE